MAADRGEHINNRQTVLDYIATVAKYIIIVLFILFIISTAGKAYRLGYEIFSQKSVDPAGTGHKVTVEIPNGTSVRGIAGVLKQNGLINDVDIFYYQERLSSDHGKIVPGTYELSTDMTPNEIIGILTENYGAQADAEEGE